jgi:hypothetical protein
MHELPPLPTVTFGRYRHYKGGEYEVIGVVRHSESLEPMVLYRPVHGESGTWVRPFGMFLETVEVHGRHQARFVLVSEAASVGEGELAATVRRMEDHLSGIQSQEAVRLLALYRELVPRFEKDLAESQRDILLARASALMLVQAAAAARGAP